MYEKSVNNLSGLLSTIIRSQFNNLKNAAEKTENRFRQHCRKRFRSSKPLVNTRPFAPCRAVRRSSAMGSVPLPVPTGRGPTGGVWANSVNNRKRRAYGAKSQHHHRQSSYHRGADADSLRAVDSSHLRVSQAWQRNRGGQAESPGRTGLSAGKAVCVKCWTIQTVRGIVVSQCSERFDAGKGGLYESVKPNQENRSLLPSQPG